MCFYTVRYSLARQISTLIIQGFIQHDLVGVGGGGGAALPALVQSSVGNVCRSPINILYLNCTHAKISHLVTSLSTGRQQVVFALLVTSCQQVWNKLLTICKNLVEIIRLVKQGCSDKSDTVMI